MILLAVPLKADPVVVDCWSPRSNRPLWPAHRLREPPVGTSQSAYAVPRQPPPGGQHGQGQEGGQEGQVAPRVRSSDGLWAETPGAIALAAGRPSIAF